MTTKEQTPLDLAGNRLGVEEIRFAMDQDYKPTPRMVRVTLAEVDRLQATLTAANARAERLREALEVYADENEWRGAGDREVWDLLFNSSKIDGDGWETARRALADDAKEGR